MSAAEPPQSANSALSGGSEAARPRAWGDRTSVEHLFVSPHLDDAVFACGQWIASSSSIVVTVFAGAPPAGAALTSWDAECGFRAGDDVIAARRAEDREALALLGATPIWLDFRDDQYGEPRTTESIADALASVIASERTTAIHFPLGLFHRDHLRASDASAMLVERFAAHAFHAYEDMLYRRIAGAVDERMSVLRERGLDFAHCSPPLACNATARKRAAVACYRSQLRALRTREAYDDLHAPEAHWRVRRRSRG